jgi:predicted Fe-Mo cluster-binding NifX family protein
MKICVTARSDRIDAQVDPRFGRCAYFVIVDADTLEYEAMANNGVNAMGGAGIQAAQSIVDKGIDVILTGNIGPNAYRVLSAAGTQIITGVTGMIREEIARFKRGEYTAISQPTVHGHFGMGGRRRGRRRKNE